MTHLAFSTNAYTRHSLPEACDRIAAAGYKAIEVLADVPHAYPATYTEHEARRLRERLDSIGVRVAAVNGNTAMGYFRPLPQSLTFEPSLISPDEVQREDRIALIRQCITIANWLGAPVVTITGGRPADLAALGLPVDPPEVLRERLLAGLEIVVEAADRGGVDLALEPEPGQLLEKTADLKAVIQEIDHPRLGANLDVGHAVCAGDDPAASVRSLGRHLKHLHLEDIQGRRHFHLIPGLGEIDFEAIRCALAEVGYAGAAAVELYTYPEAPDMAARGAYNVLAPLFPE